jgi:hypothetical protein
MILNDIYYAFLKTTLTNGHFDMTDCTYQHYYYYFSLDTSLFIMNT